MRLLLLPKWARRVITVPLTFALFVWAIGLLPLWLVVAGFISRFVPGRWRLFRLVWFAFVYLVLEVAENNRNALGFYRKRSFYRLDAAIFMAKKVEVEPELLPPRPLQELGRRQGDEEGSEQES